MSQVGRLNGKVAIVTGAAGGIGEAICERFLAEGAKVMMVDWNLEKLNNTYKKLFAKYQSKIAMFQCDVSDENAANEALSKTHSQFGEHCNFLVNNAAVMPLSPIVETTLASFNHVIGVNLEGVFNFTKEFLRRLKLSNEENKDVTGASIVNISSVVGLQGLQNSSSYAAAKAGVIAFTKTTCIEVGRFGVRCNAVLPGMIDAPLLHIHDSSYIEALTETVPMKRVGKPVEVANACLFLASDESSYINGATLQVSGGWIA